MYTVESPTVDPPKLGHYIINRSINSGIASGGTQGAGAPPFVLDTGLMKLM